MRLIDRILREGYVTYIPTQNPDGFRKLLSASQSIVMDNVAEYYFAQEGVFDGKMTVSDFPNIMLPFEYTFMEMRHPAKTGLQKRFRESGILATNFPIKTAMNFWGDEAKGILDQEGISYCSVFWLFVFDGELKKVFYYGGNGIPLNAEGEIVSRNGVVPYVGNMGIGPYTSRDKDTEQDSVTFLALFSLKIFNLFNS